MANDDIDLTALERRARTAYERARWQRAIMGLWPLAILLAIAIGGGVAWVYALPFAITNAVIAAFALQRGQQLGRAVLTGWIAGSIPLVVALLACRVPHACIAGTCYRWCTPACLVAGGIAGVWIARRATSVASGRAPHLLVGTAIAMTTGALGCMALGLGGMLGMLAGVAVASAPAWTPARR
jgi:hypothetical protein